MKIFFLFISFLTLIDLYPQKMKYDQINNSFSLDFLSDDRDFSFYHKINHVSKQIFYNNNETENYHKLPLNWENISGWINVSETYNIWSTNLETEPKFLLIDTLLNTKGLTFAYYEYWRNLNWYWENGILYLKNDSGNPDLVYDSLTVFYGGGWSSTSGNFNGDLYPDVAYSYSGGSYTFIHYGGNNFNIKPDVKLIDDGYYLANAGDTNGDGFDDLLSTQQWYKDTVFFYSGSETGILLINRNALTTPEGFDSFGSRQSVSNIPGDINGDGFADVLLASANGNLFIYYGHAEGIQIKPETAYKIRNSHKYSIEDVSYIGDINNDGYDDIAVSVIDSILPNTFFTINIFLGSFSGFDSTIYKSYEFYLAPADVYRGGSIGKCGDLNGDNIDDLIIGNQWQDSGKGQAYIFFGSESGISDHPDQTLNKPTETPNTRFGADLGEIGDFNYDGYNDLIVGSTYEDKAYIFFGGSNGVSSTPDLVISGNKFFGWSVSKVGNILGDGVNYLLALEEFGIPYLIKFNEKAVPVELLSFNLEAHKDFVKLSWSTSSEKNNKGFEIQRLQNSRITKLQDWEVIGFLSGTGTTTEEKLYTFIDKNINESGSYYYRLKQIDHDGSFEYSKEIHVSIDLSPQKFSLEQNYPNPFNPETTIKYSIPVESYVIINIYNSIGENIYIKNEGIKPKGSYDINLNAGMMTSGIYYYTLSAKSIDGKNIFSKTNKMILLK